MLEFDQNTLAHMTAALEWVCKKIPAGQDTPELRKQIADAITAFAKSGKRTYVDFQDVGMKRLVEITKPNRSRWFGWFR
jgi:hypothetical protein